MMLKQETEVVKLEVLQPSAGSSSEIRLNDLDIVGRVETSDAHEYRISLDLWGEKINAVGVFAPPPSKNDLGLTVAGYLVMAVAKHFSAKHTVIVRDCRVSICEPNRMRIVCVWW